VGAIDTESSESMNAFAAFDMPEMGSNENAVEGYDSYWANTWRDNSGKAPSCTTTLLLAVLTSGFLFLML
jgi:hypothetical protein